MSAAVVYEVNLAVERDVADAFAAWLAPHIDEMLGFDGFEGADWYERRPEDEGGDPDGPVLWTVGYRVRDRAALDAYLAGPAQRMRGDGLARFEGRFTASRRVLARR